jgi:hypothetical protein
MYGIVKSKFFVNIHKHMQDVFAKLFSKAMSGFFPKALVVDLVYTFSIVVLI